MDNKKGITLESLMMAFDANLAKSAAEFDRKLELSRKETKESDEKYERRLKESTDEYERRSKESTDEYERRSKESDEKFLQYLKQSGEAFDRRHAELDVKLKQLTEQVTGVSNSNGLFAEDYFLNAFEIDHLNFFGEKFDKIIRGKAHILEDEYDFVLINGKTAGIVEVKYKARKDDIPKALKKVNSFRINFPEYKNHNIYLGIAALSFHKELQRECTKHGIAVIIQKGDKLIINDKHMKVF